MLGILVFSAFYSCSTALKPPTLCSLFLSPRNGHHTELFMLPEPTPELTKVSDEVVLREDIWVSRRKIANAVLGPLVKRQLVAKASPVLDKSSTTEAKSSTLNTNTLFAAFSAGVLVLLLRLGGRSALLQVLGLDLQSDLPLQRSVQDILLSFQALQPSTQLIAYIGLWLGCKLLCIDAFTIVLAISSGLLYGDVLQGAIVSVFCSSLASSLVFLASRRWLRPRVVGQIESRPILKALDRACQRNGFRTVLSLRLSPLLPIPIGGYNYVYGALSVSFLDFLGGITLGSVKPYLMDSYLGVFGRSMLPSTSIEAPSADSDLIAIIAVTVLIVAGGLAAELFQTTYQEIQDEIEGLGPDKQGDWMVMWGVKPSDLPDWILQSKVAVDKAWVRVEAVLDDELNAVRSAELSDMSLTDPRGKRKEALLDQYRGTLEYERLSFTREHYSVYLLESLLFSFVLIEKFVKTANNDKSAQRN